ncbi:hypothetical protein [Amycolatopsis taiwanensis]|uniref:hypothetical protein n=1 Tax=Amycolatopsis taiwanensis TaxID=342230 RepID=UPI0012EC28F9|nr:hypothetical protein [Amycolatopsis taiwanensis]
MQLLVNPDTVLRVREHRRRPGVERVRLGGGGVPAMFYVCSRIQQVSKRGKIFHLYGTMDRRKFVHCRYLQSHHADLNGVFTAFRSP